MYTEKLSYEHLTVFAGLNQVSAGLYRFKPHVQKQVSAGSGHFRSGHFHFREFAEVAKFTNISGFTVGTITMVVSVEETKIEIFVPVPQT